MSKASPRIPEPSFSGPRLSRREIQVLRLLCAGKQGKEIAKVLQVAPSTVHQYRTQLGAKTGCTSGPQLGVWAVREGLVDIEPQGAAE
jgi:DNA-binding NarL/FixJ family response regulator